MDAGFSQKRCENKGIWSRLRCTRIATDSSDDNSVGAPRKGSPAHSFAACSACLSAWSSMMEIVSTNKSHGGVQGVYRHDSRET
ncbi:hypothetical protein, partial [Rhodoblastus sp.]|uniref:hypothetical protein n=1 Tax=Rhodoblastus sp. TaxID=1962975 RepID=UPI0035AFDAD6